MKYKLLLTIMLVCNLVFAQNTKSKKGSDEPDNKNIEKYLKDGRVGHVNNLIRLRLTPTFISYMGLSYERRLNEKFGVEVGAYIKTSKSPIWEEYREVYFAFPNGDSKLQSTHNGFGFMVFPKYYKHGKHANNGRYLGIQYSNRKYLTDLTTSMYTSSSYYDAVQTDIKSNYQSIFLVTGNTRQIGSRFTFGFEIGIGMNQDQFKAVKSYDYDYITQKITTVESNCKNSQLTAMFDLSFGVLF